MAHVEFAHICPFQTSKQIKNKIPTPNRPKKNASKVQAPTRLQARTSDRKMVFLPLILMLGKGAPIITAMYNIMHLYIYMDILI